MASSTNLHLIIILVVVLITSQNSVQGETETSKPILFSNEASEYLEPHNEVRAAIGVEPLKWSYSLAEAANELVNYQRDQMGCQFATMYGNKKYGVNQMWASGTGMTPRRVVNAWVNENRYYDHDTNTCVPNHKCGVYTQVVWKNSKELGCAQATCDYLNTSITICFYSPPGNYNGQRPY